MGRISETHGRGEAFIRRLVRKSKGCGKLEKIKRVFEGKNSKIWMKNQDR